MIIEKFTSDLCLAHFFSFITGDFRLLLPEQVTYIRFIEKNNLTKTQKC